MKVLSISPNYAKRWNSTHELFRNSLYAGHNVIQWGPGHENFDPCIPLTELTRNVDLVFIHHSKHIRVWAKDLNKIKIKKVCFQIDYFPEREEWRDNFLVTTGLDLIVFPNRFQVDWFRARNGARTSPVTFYLPFGVDTEIFKPVPKIHTNLFIGSLYSKRREFLSKYPFVSVYKYMDFLMYKSRVSFAQYTEMTSEAQAVINLPMLTDANGTRVYEGLACRAFVVTPKGAAGDYSMFESGKHLMYYDDSPLEIIQKYFVPVYQPKQAGEFHLTEEAKSIAETGYQEVLHRHTLEQRLRTMLA